MAQTAGMGTQVQAREEPHFDLGLPEAEVVIIAQNFQIPVLNLGVPR